FAFANESRSRYGSRETARLRSRTATTRTCFGARPLRSKVMGYGGMPVDHANEPGSSSIPRSSRAVVTETHPRAARQPARRHVESGGALSHGLRRDRVVRREARIEGLGRGRDAETGIDGYVCLFARACFGRRIVRLVCARKAVRPRAARATTGGERMEM